VALLITICYDWSTSGAQLPGCKNDGVVMTKFLMNLGFKVIWMRDDLPYHDKMFPSHKNIKKQIRRAVSCMKKDDVFWFQFSGHGVGIKDDNGDEHDGKDEALVTADYEHPHSRVRGTDRFLRDDWLNKHMVEALDRKRVETMIVTDCCHSGSMVDMDYQYDMNRRRMIHNPNPTRQSFGKHARSVFLSACMDSQEAQDEKDFWGNATGGALTTAFTRCLKKRGLNVPIGELLEYCVEKTAHHGQHPCLSANYPLRVDTPFCELIDGK